MAVALSGAAVFILKTTGFRKPFAIHDSTNERGFYLEWKYLEIHTQCHAEKS